MDECMELVSTTEHVRRPKGSYAVDILTSCIVGISLHGLYLTEDKKQPMQII